MRVLPRAPCLGVAAQSPARVPRSRLDQAREVGADRARARPRALAGRVWRPEAILDGCPGDLVGQARVPEGAVHRLGNLQHTNEQRRERLHAQAAGVHSMQDLTDHRARRARAEQPLRHGLQLRSGAEQGPHQVESLALSQGERRLAQPFAGGDRDRRKRTCAGPIGRGIHGQRDDAIRSRAQARAHRGREEDGRIELRAPAAAGRCANEVRGEQDAGGMPFAVPGLEREAQA